MKSAPVTPENVAQPKVVRKSRPTVGSNAGQVKKMSALFEALDKNAVSHPSTAENR